MYNIVACRFPPQGRQLTAINLPPFFYTTTIVLLEPPQRETFSYTHAKNDASKNTKPKEEEAMSQDSLPSSKGLHKRPRVASHSFSPLSPWHLQYQL